MKPDGISILQNGGVFNDLRHGDIHVVPRYKHQNFAGFYAISGEGFTSDVYRLLMMQRNIIEAINLSKSSDA